MQQVSPKPFHVTEQIIGLLHPVFQNFSRRNSLVASIVAFAQRQVFGGKKSTQAGNQLQLIFDRQLNINAFNSISIFTHARQRNYDIFVDFEGIGVLGDGRSTGAVEPELFACFRADGNKTFAHAGVGNAHHFGGGVSDCVFIVTHNVAEQGHFGQHTALGFGGIADGAQIALIQMFQPG